MDRGCPDDGSFQLSSVAIAGGSLVAVMLPVLFTGAVSVEMRGTFHLGSVGIGAAVATFFGVGSALSALGGRLVDQFGAVRSIRVAACLSAIASLTVAVLVESLVGLIICLGVAGIALALVQPAANRLLSEQISVQRLGVAFGISGGASPVAGVLAGSSVPLLALSLGWRSVYLVGAAASMIIVVKSRRIGAPQSANSRQNGMPGSSLLYKRGLFAMTLSFGLASAISMAVSSFYVDSFVSAGGSGRLAGLSLAGGSIVVIAIRSGLGVASDRMRSRHLHLCSLLIGSSAFGLVLLASGDPTWMPGGVAVALGGAWGVSSVLFLKIVRSYPTAPGQATGILQVGGAGGATIGPLFLGLYAERLGYQRVWSATVVLALCAAILMLYASARMPKSL